MEKALRKRAKMYRKGVKKLKRKAEDYEVFYEAYSDYITRDYGDHD